MLNCSFGDSEERGRGCLEWAKLGSYGGPVIGVPLQSLLSHQLFFGTPASPASADALDLACSATPIARIKDALGLRECFCVLFEPVRSFSKVAEDGGIR